MNAFLQLCELEVFARGMSNIYVLRAAQNYRAIVYSRFRSRFSGAPWWVSLSTHNGNKCTLLFIELLLRRLFLAFVYKHDVIHKTGST